MAVMLQRQENKRKKEESEQMKRELELSSSDIENKTEYKNHFLPPV